jgi:hypothetical protein
MQERGMSMDSANGHGAALARHADIVVQEVGDEVMVYDLRRHRAHCLNRTAAFIWSHCDGQTSVPQLAALVAQEFGGQVEEDAVWHGLDRLARADLLERRVTPPAGVALSRRRAARIGLGAVVALPAVMSLAAPASAQTTIITTSKKIAVGQCDETAPANCTSDTCCTGGNPMQMCQGATGCSGPVCQPAGNAADCN